LAEAILSALVAVETLPYAFLLGKYAHSEKHADHAASNSSGDGSSCGVVSCRVDERKNPRNFQENPRKPRRTPARASELKFGKQCKQSAISVRRRCFGRV